jgi:aryl-alcohol dehydrogenase-like predicted oxidoreductase
MVDLESLSSVGVGTYRMSSTHEVHFEALKTAVENGYNLIDTATNYCGGTSETLLGAFIEAYPQYQNELFIVSKVGYLPSQKCRSAALAAFLNDHALSIAAIDTDFEYSLDPAFIDFQLKQTLRKINRDYVDVYLLHNPERLLQSKNLNASTDLYAAITKAFTLLEEKVAAGEIRYYGVSSNCIFDPSENGAISCQILLDIAQRISPNHHFKFLQFPFNFKERKALQTNYKNQSLLELAHAHGLVTIGNRPLNMNENGLEFRLVTHEAQLADWSAEAADQCLAEFVAVVERQLQALTDGENTADNFEPMLLLQQHFSAFQGIEAVERFFKRQIQPFITTIFEKTSSIEPLLTQLEKQACLHALNNQTQKTQAFLDQLRQEDIPIKENSVLTACHAYIHYFKLNHVLVGLRKPAYVHTLQQTLTK